MLKLCNFIIKPGVFYTRRFQLIKNDLKTKQPPKKAAVYILCFRFTLLFQSDFSTNLRTHLSYGSNELFHLGTGLQLVLILS